MTQLEAVRDVMKDECWRAFWQIQRILRVKHAVYASEAGISARLRDLRKQGLIVDRQIVKGHKGLYEYRVRRPE